MTKQRRKDEEDYRTLEKVLNNSSQVIFNSATIHDILDGETGRNSIKFLKEAARREEYQVFMVEDGADPIMTTEPYLEDYDQQIFLDTEEAYRKAIKTVQQMEEITESEIHEIGEKYMPNELTLAPKTQRKGSITSILKANPQIKHNKVKGKYEWKK